MTTKTKHVLLAWSGGLDSTYLIQQYLEKGYIVDAVVCDFKNVGESQRKREAAAIKKMINGYFKDKPVYVFKSNIEFTGSCFDTLALGQPVTWLYNLLNYLSTGHTEVAIGYVMGDDANSYLSEIKKIWDSFQGLLYSVDKLPPLKFPLLKFNKPMIYRSIEPQLRENVTWCQGYAEEDHCGECIPCKKMIGYNLQTPKNLQDVKQDVKIEETNPKPEVKLPPKPRKFRHAKPSN